MADTRKWDEIRRRVAEASRLKARVGVLVGKGGEVRHSDSGLSMVEIAMVHEFGAPKAGIPMRSFVRSTMRAKAQEIARLSERLAKALVDGRAEPRQALDALGAYGAAQVKNTITQTDIPPALAPETVARKGSTKPLVDTGQLLNSITWEVVEEP